MSQFGGLSAETKIIDGTLKEVEPTLEGWLEISHETL